MPAKDDKLSVPNEETARLIEEQKKMAQNFELVLNYALMEVGHGVKDHLDGVMNRAPHIASTVRAGRLFFDTGNINIMRAERAKAAADKLAEAATTAHRNRLTSTSSSSSIHSCSSVATNATDELVALTTISAPASPARNTPSPKPL